MWKERGVGARCERESTRGIIGSTIIHWLRRERSPAVLSRLSRHAIPGQRRCAWKALVGLYCRVVGKKERKKEKKRKKQKKNSQKTVPHQATSDPERKVWKPLLCPESQKYNWEKERKMHERVGKKQRQRMYYFVAHKCALLFIKLTRFVNSVLQ